jgi:hypothetical protein
LLASWSTAALSAPEPLSRCNGDVRNLASFDPSAESLLVDRVDHVSDTAEAANMGSLEASADVDGAAAPYLYLTPRVANLLRDVFRNAGAERPTEADENHPSSPLADSADASKAPPKTDDAGTAMSGDKEVLPTFRQQMYRKDI